ncbi:hypothetical protein AB0F44_02915 [Nocardioides sp. NPDC023903]|uniref:hypothetical protein n=1 Tax=Nocardioides sp. NPDC023903 TaxID=3157195 RepID=UPI00340C2002
MPRRLRFGRSWFVRWTVTVTVAETLGFIAPAFIGTITTGLPTYAALPALLAAGAVEGAVLGWAQVTVLRRAVPGVNVLRWVMLTAGAAVVAYLLGTVVTLAAAGSESVRIVVSALCGALLLASIGGAQWIELRHHVARAVTWIPVTAVAWLLALGVFLAIATPLWHEGQRVWVAIMIGVGAGAVMAFVQATVTGWWLVRLFHPTREAPLRTAVDSR